jgi:hypothetical protein
MAAFRKALLSVLFIAACSFAAYGYVSGLRGFALFFWAVFSLALPAVALLALRFEPAIVIRASSMAGLFSDFTTSFALALAIFLAAGVLLLPVAGFAVFLSLQEPWFPIAFLLLTACCYPLTKRFVR